MGGEPAIVVERRKELTYLVCQAAELEHAVMCEYLLFAIAKEEMLHWAVVQNLLTSVGSTPYVSRPHMPHQARGTRRGCSFACCTSVRRGSRDTKCCSGGSAKC